jgi:hypothetical protein
LNGDGRDDYLIWDAEGGLTGFLNMPTRHEGVPLFISQGPPKTLADGIHQTQKDIRLADMDGDGKDDYVYVDSNGALWIWWNRGVVDTSLAIDGIRFADIDGDGLDDYIWLDPLTGAPTVYLNGGFNEKDSLGWQWNPLSRGRPIASGMGRAVNVKFGDLNGDGKADYLVLDPKTGELVVALNDGFRPGAPESWSWMPQPGPWATGLGPGKHVTFADIDGDGYDDYIYIHPNGATTIYRNNFAQKAHKILTQPDTPYWLPMPEADASGIGQRPEEISFHDINGDGKADYIWTRAVDGAAFLWTNNYPNKPTWVARGEIAGGVGTSGQNIRYATMQNTGRASYMAVDPNTGAVAAWLNGCNRWGLPRRKKLVYISIVHTYPKPILEGIINLAPGKESTIWDVAEGWSDKNFRDCNFNAVMHVNYLMPAPGMGPFPVGIGPFNVHGLFGCVYMGTGDAPGKIACHGSTYNCHTRMDSSQRFRCEYAEITPMIECDLGNHPFSLLP